MQVLLHQNPRIYGSPTSPLLEFQFAARGNLQLPEVKSQPDELMKASFISLCRGIANSYYEVISDRPVICDKNRGWSHYFEWVEQWNEQPKMICMVRDLRSILASMERAYRKNRHLPVGPDDPANLQNMTVSSRVGYWLSTQPVGLALERTLDLFQRELADRILFVKYENLCDEPAQTMSKVYEFIEEEPFEHDFENIVKEVHEDCSHFGPYGDHSVKSRITPPKRDDWSEVLSLNLANQIRSAHSWYFETFGY